MSNSLDSFLKRIGDVTIERVTPRGGSTGGNSSRSGQEQPGNSPLESLPDTPKPNSTVEAQNPHEESSEESSGESSDGEQEKKVAESMQPDEIEEIHSEGSGDDMDLDETIDSRIGVRMESERQQSSSMSQEDDEEPVNILDTLPLEGAPIEGQEVSEAEILGKPISKSMEEDECPENDNEKDDLMSEEEEDGDGSKRQGDSDNSEQAKKKQKKDDGNEGSTSECETKAEKKLANMRRNIREVMDETQLDEATLSAQRQEMERLRRVQEQQRIIREVQRQIAINRQNSKTQTRVISLLQGKQNQAGTTISQASSPPSSQVRLPNTVLLKVNSGSGAGPASGTGPGHGTGPGVGSGSQTSSNLQSSQGSRRPMDGGMRWQKGRGGYQGAQTSISRVGNRSTNTGPQMLQQRIRMMTPSVSISPVVPKKEPLDRLEYYSDSELSDVEADQAFHDKHMHMMGKSPGGQKQVKAAKGKDVVTISSSSESSDDDCIVLSDPSGGEETDNEDDPSNSGMHTNDRYNIPDEHGRVLINVGHPDTEPDVYLAPQVARIIKPHQIGGIRFLYDNIVESIERYKTSSGFGCILAHSMGLGKTLQVASFCDIFFRCTTAKTVLCIMPINTLQNWLAEFNMWLPYEDPSMEKVEKQPGTNIKTEPGVESKQEIKEECGSQSDVSNMSRPISTESASRFGQDTTSVSQSPNLIPDGAFPHQNYEQPRHNMMPSYENMMNKPTGDSNTHLNQLNQNYQGDMSQNAMYNSNSSNVSTGTSFDPMKSDLNCSGMQNRPNFDVESQSSDAMYSTMDSRSQGPMYPEGSMYSGMENHVSMPMYPNYENASSTGFEQFPKPPALNEQEIKKEPLPSTENVYIKKEPEESVKKEDSPSAAKEGTTEEKKETVEVVKTPFCVDSPIGLDLRPRHFRLHILNDSHKTMAARARVVQEWQKGGGVLLIGYELYRQLSMKKPNKAKRKRGQPFKDTVDVEEEDKNKGYLDEMHTALVSPGPDLVICDEGHRIKNSHASISVALKQMRTKRRIVLTGYPLQNNLLEYWCMVDFVRPNYLGTKSEFCNMFERPIQNGQCIDSTPQDIRLMRYRAHVLHALLEGFVQRRSHSVLQISLPRKEEYILLVRMTPHQRKLYDTFMNQVVKTRAVPNPLKAFAVCCKIWNHPDILYHFLRKRQANEEDDLDLEETIGEKPAPGGKRTKARQPKGESKKGKKGNATVKNKPAASVQPNSSSTSTENAECDNQGGKKPGNFQNFPAQMPNSGFSNAVSTPQTGNTSFPQNYPNYRPNEQNNYYRNENPQGEYNEFYNNQGQQHQRYPNQQFQQYPQTSTYNSTQGYPNQPQNYIPGNDQPANHQQRYTSGTGNADFRPEQNQGTQNYENQGMFPRQTSYPYQEQGRNYGQAVNQPVTQPMNQGQNYPQVGNQQPTTFQNQIPNAASNVPHADFSTYPQANQTPGFPASGSQNNSMYPRNDNQSMQTPVMAYPSNQQQSQNSTSQNQPTNYLPNQSGQNVPAQNTAQSFPTGQSNQTGVMPGQNFTPAQQNVPVPNQQHPYPNPVGQNAPQPQNFGQNQPGPQSVNHGYIGNQGTPGSMPQNQMHGYPATQGTGNVAPGAASNYQAGQQSGSNTGAQNPTMGYQTDQQNPVRGYPNLSPQNSGTGYSAAQQSASVGPTAAGLPYPAQPGALTGQRYSSSTQPTQNQGHNYPVNQQPQNPLINQAEQMYPRPDTGTQSNYPSGGNPPQDFQAERPGATSGSSNASGSYPSGQNQPPNAVLPNYPSDVSNQNQVTQFKGPEDPFWQRNYSQPFRPDQCNDSYYRDSNVNRYQGNYFPPQNYQNQPPYEYTGGNHPPDINARTDETKGSQTGNPPHLQNQATCTEKSSKEPPAASIGVQSQNNVPGYNNNNSNNSNNNSSNSETNCQNSSTQMPRPLSGMMGPHGCNNRMGQGDSLKEEEKEKEDVLDKEKEEKSDDEVMIKDEEKDSKSSPSGKEDPGIPYDWATELMKGYVPGLIDASAKMTLFFCILEEAIRLGDRVLAFSQSLFTLNLIEDFLARNNLKYADGQTDAWIKNVNYYRLDGSTSALEREKLINEFNNNPKIHLFLVSTRAGSLGINLVGANRAIVFDASWNPCHDTQAVCRVYRYGQQKPCFVYRLVTDNCLERKIYDRQISKQGMADRVVDQCNPDAHLSLKEATTLSWDWEEDSQVQDFSQSKDSYSDEIMHRVLERHSSLLTKQPFQHESLLVDRKDKKLSQAEKRLARRGYELEKMAANCSRPSYNYIPGNTAARAGGLQIRAIRGDGGTTPKPVASVRPMQQRGAEGLGPRGPTGSRWIPAEVWQRQGMSAQEMTLPLDVVIPTNSPDKGSIVLKAGQRVMVLKSPKGIYMQLESGKIIAIRTALKLNQQKREEEPKKGISSMSQRSPKQEVGFPLRNNAAISIIPKSSSSSTQHQHHQPQQQPGSGRPLPRPTSASGYRPFPDKEVAKRPRPVATAAAKPYLSQVNLTNQVSLSRLPKVKQEMSDHSNLGENSNSMDGHQVRTEQRVEEVRLEDVVAEVSSNTQYSPPNLSRPPNPDLDSSLKKQDNSRAYVAENVPNAQVRHSQSDVEASRKIEGQCAAETKELPKAEYGHGFPGQKDKSDSPSDDIIIEEPTSTASSQTTTSTSIPQQPPPANMMNPAKGFMDPTNSSAPNMPVRSNPATAAKEAEMKTPEVAPAVDPSALPQNYPYPQFPRYYDYSDPRSRTLSNPYGAYFPGVPPHATNQRTPAEPPKPQPDATKAPDEAPRMMYAQLPSSAPKPPVGDVTETTKAKEPTEPTNATATSRDDAHVPTAFTHPTSTRYPAPYPPGPYDPYSQHYPPAPGSSAAYPPSGAPGYPAYGGPTYNTDYARMYSAFHGPPPPAADPYMHRGYAPSTHPPNYYPPFPHPPPPPYPNYTFLPPYPNPNMPNEPQPPTQ